MIRASEGLRRHVRRGGFGSGLAALVVVLVVLVGVHPISDNIFEHAEIVCAAALVVLGFALAFAGPAQPSVFRPLASGASPTGAVRLVRPTLVFNDERSLPLRR